MDIVAISGWVLLLEDYLVGGAIGYVLGVLMGFNEATEFHRPRLHYPRNEGGDDAQD